jgi:secondary thiamine-phosphate synthase enzyme
MKIAQETVEIQTRGRGLYDVTAEVAAVVRSAKVQLGVCTVFVQHTSASLVIQENADRAVQRDMERWLGEIAPESPDAYEHDAEGSDDMPAHLRSAMTRTSESVPVRAGQLALGTWQAVYLWEHRRAGQRRRLVVTVMGT